MRWPKGTQVRKPCLSWWPGGFHLAGVLRLGAPERMVPGIGALCRWVLSVILAPATILAIGGCAPAGAGGTWSYAPPDRDDGLRAGTEMHVKISEWYEKAPSFRIARATEVAIEVTRASGLVPTSGEGSPGGPALQVSLRGSIGNPPPGVLSSNKAVVWLHVSSRWTAEGVAEEMTMAPAWVVIDEDDLGSAYESAFNTAAYVVHITEGVSRLRSLDPVEVLHSVLRAEGAPAWLREASVSALGRIGTPAASRELVGLLSVGDWKIRAIAALSLGESGDPSNAPALGRLLEDVNAIVRQNAVVAIWRLGVPARESFLKALEDNDPEVRRWALLGLASTKEASAVGAMSRALKDPDPDVAKQAAKSLGAIRSSSAIASLVEALGSESEYVQMAAKKELVEMGSPALAPLLGALESDRYVVRANAVDALGAIGDVRAATRLNRIAENDPDPIVRALAAGALKQFKAEFP